MEVHDERALLELAEEAARVGARELMSRFGQLAEGVHTKSTPTDLVSEADVESESSIRELLRTARPDDGFLGEESGEAEAFLGQGSGELGAGVGGGSGEPGEGGGGGSGEPRERALRWVVDPLDGTVNYLFGIPAFAVSVACEDEAGTVVGVVLDPVREECFAATRSGPATLNGSAITSSDREDLSQAMVATGFAYDSAVRVRQGAVVARVLPRVRDIRRFGSAALDLAWCACGRWDAYYERGPHAWDVAAGALIATNAGLELRDIPEAEGVPAGLMVAPAGLIEELYQLVAG